MTREELIAKIEEIQAKYGEDYDIIAIRSQDEEFPEAGSEFDFCSKVWDYENECSTEEEMDGVYATSLSASGDDIYFIGKHFQAGGYTGGSNHIAVLGATRYGYTYGNDPAEIILKYPIVLEVIR